MTEIHGLKEGDIITHRLLPYTQETLNKFVDYLLAELKENVSEKISLQITLNIGCAPEFHEKLNKFMPVVNSYLNNIPKNLPPSMASEQK